jgi:hypothetical protein
MITYMVLDKEYLDYTTFSSEKAAREYINQSIEEGRATIETFTLFRREELEI